MAESLLVQRYSATDVHRASEAVQAVFGVGEVDAAEAPFSYEQRALVDDGVSATRILSSGRAVRLREVATPDLMALVVRDGSVRITLGPEVVELRSGDLGLIPLGATVELRWDRVTLDVFSFPQSSLRRLLGVTEGTVRLRAPRLTPRSAKVAALWVRLANLLAGQVLEEPELYERDQIREQLIAALLGATIEAFDLSNASEDDPGSDEAVLDRAGAFMRAHLGEPIAIPDVARAAGISVRGLQLTFQRELETTPALHLRRLRLTAAREVLLRDGGRTTVGAVARRFGYTNLGRFSAHYRASFGEPPSATVQA